MILNKFFLEVSISICVGPPDTGEFFVCQWL